jgi:hypothetical protein
MATAFHFFKVNNGPVNAFPLLFFALGASVGSSKGAYFISGVAGWLLQLSK